MNLFKAIEDSLQQLTELIEKLDEENYCKKLQTLSGSTIGQHVRHIIEMYDCLLSEYESGQVCYDDRKRDIQIEINREFAKNKIAEILSSFKFQNKEIQLKILYSNEEANEFYLPSNYYRELVYNLEHSVHHKALIKAGLNELKITEVPENFGVASSTIRHRDQQCAQ